MRRRNWIATAATVFAVASVLVGVAHCDRGTSALAAFLAWQARDYLFFLWAVSPSLLLWIAVFGQRSIRAVVVVSVVAVGIAGHWIVTAIDNLGARQCKDWGYVYVLAPISLLAISVATILVAIGIGFFDSRRKVAAGGGVRNP